MSKSKYGNIIVHRTQNNIDGVLESLTYNWKGKPWIILDIRDINPKMIHGDNIHIGPYRMRIVSEHDNGFKYECVRTDYPFWRLVVYSHHASKFLRIINARIIVTCAVWRLADFNPECVPSWNVLHFVKWLKQLRLSKTSLNQK